jgi:hypothetical protein
MNEKYLLKEVHIEVQQGVKLIAEVPTLEALHKLLSDIKKNNISPVAIKKEHNQGKGESKKVIETLSDTAAGKIEINAGLTAGTLLKSNILAFKDDVPQLLRPSAFNKAMDAALVLLHAVETGLRNSTIEYESFKALYEDQNIKSGTPLSMLITNLRNLGYLDKKEYRDSRKLRLTPKGDKKAIEILKKLISQ